MLLKAALYVLVGAVLNAARGGKIKPLWLAGHARFWYVAASAAILVFAVDLYLAVLIGLSLLFWAQWSWGRWYTLNRKLRSLSGNPNALEKVIERIGGQNDYICLFARMAFGLIPLVLLASFITSIWFLLFAPITAGLIVLAYDVAWDLSPSPYQIRVAEFLTGGVLGLTIFLIF